MNKLINIYSQRVQIRNNTPTVTIKIRNMKMEKPQIKTMT